MDINIDALYKILKQNQGDVNDAVGSKKKTVVVASNPLALIAEKTNVSRSKEKVVVSSDSKGSEADDFSELKKITALLAKPFNRRKFYSKPINNNLRTSSTSQSTNKKQEFVKTDNKKVEKKDDEKKRVMSRVKCYNCKKEGHFVKDCKKVKVKDYEYYKTKMLLAKKDKDEQVILAEDQAWMESSSDSDQVINANMVFMAQIKKVLSDSEASSSSTDEKIFKDSFQTLPMFDEDFNPLTIAVSPVQEATAPRAVVLADSPVSTIDQDAPSTNTPMVEKSKLDEDLQGKPVDAILYRGMIGSLMYLTSSRLDLIYTVCLCARYQAKPTEKHLNAVKRIFRYLKGTINMGLWYSKDTKAFDDALVALVDRLEFEKCNMRLTIDIKPKEATFQVVLDALALTPFYHAFIITTEVLAIYIQILQICLKILGQEFEDLPLEHGILSFIKDLRHSGDIIYLTDVSVDYLHQPWRAFATIIKKCLSGKEIGMDKIRLSRAQILS
nr:hypothetical protein [Tanacetum cinerariifolium]